MIYFLDCGVSDLKWLINTTIRFQFSEFFQIMRITVFLFVFVLFAYSVIDKINVAAFFREGERGGGGGGWRRIVVHVVIRVYNYKALEQETNGSPYLLSSYFLFKRT